MHTVFWNERFPTWITLQTFTRVCVMRLLYANNLLKVHKKRFIILLPSNKRSFHLHKVLYGFSQIFAFLGAIKRFYYMLIKRWSSTTKHLLVCLLRSIASHFLTVDRCGKVSISFLIGSTHLSSLFIRQNPISVCFADVLLFFPSVIVPVAFFIYFSIFLFTQLFHIFPRWFLEIKKMKSINFNGTHMQEITRTLAYFNAYWSKASKTLMIKGHYGGCDSLSFIPLKRRLQ